MRRRAEQRRLLWLDGWFVRVDGRPYVPNRGQEAFHSANARFRAFIGGRGSGKTAAGAQEALLRIRQGLSGAIYNPDFENFKSSTWPEFRDWVPWDKVILKHQYRQYSEWEPSQPFNLAFTNGATVRCKGLRDPDQARGPNINWLWYDEAGRDRLGKSWLLAIAAVRVGAAPAAWATATPVGRRHWLYRSFVLSDLDDEIKKMLVEAGYVGDLYYYAQASINDNRENLDPVFYASMRASYTGKLAEQELEGMFVEVGQSLVYEDFNEQNITNDMDVDLLRPFEIAVDDGYVDPRAVLFIQRQGTYILVFDEIYESLQLEESTVEKIVTRYPGLPALAAVSHEAVQLRRRLREANIPARNWLSRRAPGRRSTRKEAIKRTRALICDGNGRRTILVHPRCKNLIREITQDYHYPEALDRNSNEMPADENDHAAQALESWCWLRVRGYVNG
jgi:phage terminase large subunit